MEAGVRKASKEETAGGVCAGGSVGLWGFKARLCATWPGDGEVVRVFNARGACFAGVSVTEAVRPASFGSPAAPGTTPRATRTSRPAPILPSSRQPSRDPAPQPAGYPDKADAAERFRPTLRWREPDSNSGSRRERPTAG